MKNSVAQNTVPKLSWVLLLANLLMEGFGLLCYINGLYGPYQATELTARTLCMVAVLWCCFQNYKFISPLCRGYYYLAACVYISRVTQLCLGWVRMGNAFFQLEGNAPVLAAVTVLYTAVYCYTTRQLLYNPQLIKFRKDSRATLPPIPRKW